MILPFDDPAFLAYSDLRAELERCGTPIGSLDTMIASRTLSQQATLITSNTRELAKCSACMWTTGCPLSRSNHHSKPHAHLH